MLGHGRNVSRRLAIGAWSIALSSGLAISSTAALATTTSSPSAAPTASLSGLVLASHGRSQSVRARVPVGCDRLVSALVRSASADRVGRCVT